MTFSRFLRFGWLALYPLAVPFTSSLQAADKASLKPLQDALTLHASFDQGINADYAKGDSRLYSCLRPGNQSEARPGLNTDGKTQRIATGGLAGGTLKFNARNATWIFFPGESNVSFSKSNWNGTLSVWLRLDPEEDLDPGYTDPIQITPRKWNDAAFFVDFDKDGDPRDFRLGAFPDLSVWNADNKNVNNIPEDQRPLVTVKNPPFGSDKWTHVVFTWEGFNSGDKTGKATFYLDGKNHGELKGWDQTWSWSESEEVRLFLGLNYIGLLDELSCFNRSLSAQEVKQLFELGENISTIVPK